MLEANDICFRSEYPVLQLKGIGEFITENAEELLGDYEKIVVTENGFVLTIKGIGSHDCIPTVEICKVVFPFVRKSE